MSLSHPISVRRKRKLMVQGCVWFNPLDTEGPRRPPRPSPLCIARYAESIRHPPATPEHVRRIASGERHVIDRVGALSVQQPTIGENPLSYRFHNSSPNLNMRDIKVEIINTKEQIGDLVDWLVCCHAPPVPYSPVMYIDLEGVNLSREGSLSILTLLIDTRIPTRRVCLFDVHSLGAKAFNTAGIK